MREDMRRIMPEEYSKANDEYAKFMKLQQALNKIPEGIEAEQAKALTLADKQKMLLKKAVSGNEEAYNLVNQLPLGEKSLQRSEQLTLAQELAKQQEKYEGVPIGWINLISRVVSGVPRKITINKILPEMLQKAEGTYTQNPYSAIIQKMLQVQNAKESGYIDAEQYRERK